MLYLDFGKVFDSVPHKCLLSKLSARGINGNAKGGVEARKQRVVIKGSKSSWKDVTSRVPHLRTHLVYNIHQ